MTLVSGVRSKALRVLPGTMKPALTLEQQLERSLHQVRAKKVRMSEQQAIVKAEQQSRMAAAVVVHGDLSAMNEGQLATYYVELCRTLDLNPLTRPFTLLKLNGKLIYYANKDCSDQLRKRDKVSVRIVGRETVGDLLIVTAEASMPDGRVDQAIGALSVGALKGENLANAMMKCETKAKRRVTLSICGLGMLDEEEVASAQLEGDRQDTGGAWSSHDVSPDANPQGVDREAYARAMATMRDCDKAVFDPGCTWETLQHWRGIMGSKGAPSELGKEMSAMYRGDLSEGERKDLSALWNRVDRKLTALEGKLKAPSVEANFVDEPETDAFSPGREPGEEG
jgi:hypothetical protein